MEKKMETTIVYRGYIGIMENGNYYIVYWGYRGIMEKKMEAAMGLRSGVLQRESGLSGIHSLTPP